MSKPEDPGYPPPAYPGDAPPQQPPPPGYAAPPPQQGYPAQPPPQQGYTAQPPPQQGYTAQPPPPQAYPTQQTAPAAYPQAQYGAYPQQGTTVVVAAAPIRFHEAPMTMECPHCKAQITTATERKIGLMAWMCVGAAFLIGLAFPFLLLGCCFIPLCIPACKDVVHSCPNCQKHIGTYNRMN